jgi:hypothetical protein
VPLDTRAKTTAERLLILTESLADSILSDRVEETSELIVARQATLDQLGTMELDAAAMAILERVVVSERDLISLVQRTQGVATQDMVQLYAGMKQVRAYQRPQPSPGLSRTG